MSLSNDTVAVLDTSVTAGPGAGATLRFFDTAQGRPLGEPFSHTLEIKELALSQVRQIGADWALLFLKEWECEC